MRAKDGGLSDAARRRGWRRTAWFRGHLRLENSPARHASAQPARRIKMLTFSQFLCTGWNAG